MDAIRSLLSGAAGAVALTAVHQTARSLTDDAPRMDLLAMDVYARALRAAGRDVPQRGQGYRRVLAGDLVSNAAYYSLVGLGRPGGAWWRGAALGLAAGIGGVVLPPRLGLGSKASGRTPATAAMTVAWYTLGGLAAAGVARWL